MLTLSCQEIWISSNWWALNSLFKLLQFVTGHLFSGVSVLIWLRCWWKLEIKISHLKMCPWKSEEIPSIIYILSDSGRLNVSSVPARNLHLSFLDKSYCHLIISLWNTARAACAEPNFLWQLHIAKVVVWMFGLQAQYNFQLFQSYWVKGYLHKFNNSAWIQTLDSHVEKPAL